MVCNIIAKINLFVTGSTEMRIKSLSAIAANPFQSARGVFLCSMFKFQIFSFCITVAILDCSYVHLLCRVC